MASKKRIILPIVILVAAILVAVLLASMRQAPERGGAERLPVLVDFQVVQPDSHQFSIAAQGNVLPKYDTTLVAEVSGQVVHVDNRFVVGGFFNAGDVLLQIDPSDYEVAREEARANLARAQAAVAEERAMGRVAEAEWRSIEAGEIPSLGLREPQLASALAELQSADARLSQAERNLERTRIRAPFDGVLQSREVTLGQYVSTNSVVGNILGTNIAEIRLPLTDQDMAFLDIPTGLVEDKSGPAVTLKASISGRRYEWPGTIVRTEGVVDAGSQVTYAVVEVQDPYNRQGSSHERVLNFGRFVEAEVEGIRLENLVELPRYAVNSNNMTWVISDEAPRILEQREVVVERRDRHTVFVREGLAAGERVMLTQLDNPISGQRVRIEGDEEATEVQDGSDASTESDEAVEGAADE
ncbi:efflux RND transporter periplasmic adaptor subunit [Aliidiomarina soli]|uniref:Efflux RND transporter periplasmic adaptor subunit n=1 Tax=Aliidiomarina soli TaxID=1928574 RepID=A0A432WH80_9GAMM|nr:efflux RND transporter periplasmic adaptor subunit [Aliidiomarina soli]RUO33138.1 efflux RND transporter periplasmic adaptor subunit [Aliidiomarina soli]